MTKHDDELLRRVKGGTTLGPSRRARLRRAVVGGLAGAGAAGAGAAQAAAAQAVASAPLPMLAIPTSLKVLAVALVATGGIAWGLTGRTAHDLPDGSPRADVAEAIEDLPVLAASEAAPRSEVLAVPAAEVAPAPTLAAASSRVPRSVPRPRAATGLEPAEEVEANVSATEEVEVATEDAEPASDLVGREVALLRRARSALTRGDSVAALALLDEHERDFPRGDLSGDRELLAVRAHCALGDRAGAERAARAYIEVHPASAHARALATPCD